MSLLDIGTLSGTIELDDRLTAALHQITGKVESFADKFVDALGPLGVTIGVLSGAVIGLGATIVTLGVKGSEINDVTEGFDRLSGSVENAEAILQSMRDGIVGTMTDMDLMERANRLLASGVKANADDFGVLTAASKILANEGFGSVQSIMSQVDRGMQTGQVTRLGRIGITLDLKEAELAYATSMGKAVSALTTEQSLEVRRVALLEAANKIVKDAGAINLSFADRIHQVSTAIKNWVNEFESAIAKSPNVTNAFLAIKGAIEKAFGGSSQDMMEWALKWVNRFADFVGKYGPPIIKTFGEIKTWIGNVIDTVVKAWNAIPDWLKNIARDAALAGAALYITSKAFSTIQASMEGISGEVREGGMRSIVSEWATISDATISVGKLFSEYIPNVLEVSGAAFVALRLKTAALGEGLAIAAGSGAVFLAQMATGIIVVAAAAAVITAAYQAYKLWTENAERAASAEKQAVIDRQNLVRINTALGTSYTDLNEVSKAWPEHLKDVAEKTAKAASVTAELSEWEKAHKAALDSLFGSLVAAAGQLDVTSEAIAKLNLNQLLSHEGSKMAIQLWDQQIEKGKQLNDEESRRYNLIITSRLAEEFYSLAKLANTKVTLEQIEALRKLGMRETEIAEHYKTNITALKAYSDAKLKIRELDETLVASDLSTSATAHQQKVAQFEKEYQQAIKFLDMRFAHNVEIANKERQLRDDKIAQDGTNWNGIVAQSREALQEIADAYRREFDMMVLSGKTFNQDVWDAMRDKITAAQDAVHGYGLAHQNSMELAAAAAKKLADEQEAVNQKLKEEMELRRTMTIVSDRYTSAQFLEAATGLGHGITAADMRQMVTSGMGSLPEILKAAQDAFAALGSGINGFNQKAIDLWLAMGGSIPSDLTTAAARPTLANNQVVAPASAGVVGKGWGDINNTFHVNGTAEESARQIGDILMRNLKSGRQFGTV